MTPAESAQVRQLLAAARAHRAATEDADDRCDATGRWRHVALRTSAQLLAVQVALAAPDATVQGALDVLLGGSR